MHRTIATHASALRLMAPALLRAAAFGTVMLFAACAPLSERGSLPAGAPPPARAPQTSETAPADFPFADYEVARKRRDDVYVVDSARSLVTVVVHRGGRLARLGHDHVVASREVNGFVDVTAGRADLYARLDRMSVDEPALRREAHFDTQPSATDIAGTRTNMLERVLHVERYPFVEVAVRRVGAAPSADTSAARSDATSAATDMRVSITLEGVTREVPVQMALSRHRDVFEASGSFSLDQTDFGLVPMSLFGGAITVENRLDLRFDVRGRRELVPIAAATHRRSD